MEKMETFADYILNEKNPGSKMEITKVQVEIISIAFVIL